MKLMRHAALPLMALAVVMVVCAAAARAAEILDPRILADPWYLAGAPLLPIPIAFIVQRQWSSAMKAAVALLVVIAFSVAVCLHAGITRGQDLLGAFFVVLTVVKVTYEAVWKPVGIAPAIEGATSPGSGA